MLLNSMFSNMFDDMMFGSFPMLSGSSNRFGGQMKSDIREFDDHYDLSMELAGYSKGDIQADLDHGYLTIHAEHSDNHDEKDDQGRVIRTERFSGSCQRSFFVGEDVRKEDIQAQYQDGILHISIPKAMIEAPKEEPKLIVIQ